MKNSIKIILLLIFFNFMESVISIPLSKIYIIFPLTFLFYSYYIYKSKENKSPIEAFLLGLLIDLISGSYFGLNAINYWENEDRYFPSVGHSHPFKFLGIKHARNNNELRVYVKQHTNGIKFISEFFKTNHNEIKNIFN